MFLNRESLDQVSNSKAPFVFVLDFWMAETNNPEVTANVAETEAPAPEAEAVPKCGGTPPEVVPKSGSPIPPTGETPPPEGESALTESKTLTSTMSVELATARAETDALLEGIKECFHLCGRCGRPRGNFKVDQSDVVLGLKAQRSHFTGSPH